jgi:hypothetical protein
MLGLVSLWTNWIKLLISRRDKAREREATEAQRAREDWRDKHKTTLVRDEIRLDEAVRIASCVKNQQLTPKRLQKSFDTAEVLSGFDVLLDTKATEWHVKPVALQRVHFNLKLLVGIRTGKWSPRWTPTRRQIMAAEQILASYTEARRELDSQWREPPPGDNEEASVHKKRRRRKV